MAVFYFNSQFRACVRGIFAVDVLLWLKVLIMSELVVSSTKLVETPVETPKAKEDRRKGTDEERRKYKEERKKRKLEKKQRKEEKRKRKEERRKLKEEKGSSKLVEKFDRGKPSSRDDRQKVPGSETYHIFVR